MDAINYFGAPQGIFSKTLDSMNQILACEINKLSAAGNKLFNVNVDSESTSNGISAADVAVIRQPGSSLPPIEVLNSWLRAIASVYDRFSPRLDIKQSGYARCPEYIIFLVQAIDGINSTFYEIREHTDFILLKFLLVLPTLKCVQVQYNQLIFD